ncbi:hypothetical protein AcV5_005429 [Taiwanofungus camphoratus]|nr:hypothetical protein AcV5_005429 [Antrodia cinnamomea]
MPESNPHTPKRSASRTTVRSPYFARSSKAGQLVDNRRKLPNGYVQYGSDPRSETVTSCYFSPTSTARDAPSQSHKRPASNCCVDLLEHEDDVLELYETTDEGHRSLLQNIGFRNFYAAFMHSYEQLYLAKPILIQEHVAYDPWKVLVAVMLLNKTAGRHAVPTFFDIIARWPTAEALSKGLTFMFNPRLSPDSRLQISSAPPDVLEELIRHLGLGKSRTQRLISLSQTYTHDPPVPDILRPSRCYSNVRMQCGEDGLPTIVRQRYPSTAISHLPGSGPYALDSYRIFCAGADEWKSVMPQDKELIKYLKWRWAVDELRQWDPLRGCMQPVDIDYLQQLNTELCR